MGRGPNSVPNLHEDAVLNMMFDREREQKESHRRYTESTIGEGAQYTGGYKTNASVLSKVKQLLDHMASVEHTYPSGSEGRAAFLALRDRGCDLIAEACEVRLDAVREAYSNEVHRRNRERSARERGR